MSGNITVLFIMEMIGTVAFSCSGAMLAIRRKLDLLGIIILGVVTAVGGGMLRDVLIGVHPPALFVKPIYVTVAVAAAAALFLAMKSRRLTRLLLEAEYYDWIMNLMDAIGLGAFTVVGVNTAISKGYGGYIFLTVFLGVITGVGGGLLRDMMAGVIPGILRKHVYACASIAGALCYVVIAPYVPTDLSLIVSAALVTAIRLLARHYKWNLPRCDIENEEG